MCEFYNCVSCCIFPEVEAGIETGTEEGMMCWPRLCTVLFPVDSVCIYALMGVTDF